MSTCTIPSRDGAKRQRPRNSGPKTSDNRRMKEGGGPPSSARVAPNGDDDEPRSDESLQSAGAGSGLRPDPHLDREPGEDSVVVVRRDQEAGDDQLSHLQAGARWPVLRPHLRPDQGLRVLV